MRSAASRFSCAMRLASTVSRAAISAVSTVRLRAISKERTSSSRDILSAASLRSSRMRTDFRQLCRGDAISADSTASLRAISSPRVSWSALMRSAAIFLSSAMRAISVDFAGGNLRRLDGLDAPDLAAPRFFLGDDPIDRDFLFRAMRDASTASRRRDLGFFDRAGAGDVAGANTFFLLDTRGRR